MDFTKAKEVFAAYLKQYDANDDKIRLKIVHTYGVVSCASQITEKMGLPKEEKELAKLIALLHDIGRFEQIRRFDSFESDTMDHAAYGVQVLFDEGMIEQFVEERDYDEIIRTAIAKHSDFELEGVEDERTLLHAKLIRDADKLDNCRVKLEDSMETLLNATEEEVGKEEISTKVYDTCMSGKSILSADRKTKMDYWVSYVAYFNDMNFKETLAIVEENNYLSRIIHRIPYSNSDTKKKMGEIEKKIGNYIRREYCARGLK